jgi:hypothetical protein
MPVEIKELHIRVAVNAQPPQAAAAQASGGKDSGGESGGADKDAIVAECVEQVLEIIRARRER